MSIVAKLRYSRLSCQKACLVADQIRGLRVSRALGLLLYGKKKASKIIQKLLLSAVSNARSKNIEQNSLRIMSIFVNQAPSLKRVKSRAKGRSNRILKRCCHITIELSK